MNKPVKKATGKTSDKTTKKAVAAKPEKAPVKAAKATKATTVKTKEAKPKPVAKSTLPKASAKAPKKAATSKTASEKPIAKKAVSKKTVVKKTEDKPAAKKVAKKLDAVSMLVKIAVKAIQDKKGKDIVTMDLRGIKNSVTDFFIVCHGESNVQVNALARSVEEEIYKAVGEDPVHKEGFANLEWILLDYFNMVVHIFNKEKRDFFGIERLWADAEIEEIK